MGLSKDITRIVLAGIGIASLASLVYFAGPFVAIGAYHPLDNYIIREIVIVLLVAAVASFSKSSSGAAKKTRQRSPPGSAKPRRKKATKPRSKTR